ncbi:rhodanese-like domain-containing protein [Pareuzebyella sediminis]|uniref:rhodanese-like domain-containing protein n=1 Tax=Pareuzebyella sediminis TaxID=2607998 RepID=UPI0011F04B01|nr:rhodanese-like domain-containing protein [Pareuzebyella sediminis]
MQFFFSVVLIVGFLSVTQAQNNLDRTLDRLNRGNVPYIQVEELQKRKNLLVLDTRKKEEYLVSHLKHALWVGYEDFNPEALTEQIKDKSKEIVVYCSIGIRSENIGKKLIKLGFTKVRNLYGGIFEWKNRGYPVYDSEGNETENIHAYNKRWGRLLKKGNKVYDMSEITDQS